jgi:hypothetical protein
MKVPVRLEIALDVVRFESAVIHLLDTQKFHRLSYARQGRGWRMTLFIKGIASPYCVSEVRIGSRRGNRIGIQSRNVTTSENRVGFSYSIGANGSLMLHGLAGWKRMFLPTLLMPLSLARSTNRAICGAGRMRGVRNIGRG